MSVKNVKNVETVKPVEKKTAKGFLDAAREENGKNSIFAPGKGAEEFVVVEYLVREHTFKQQGKQLILDLRGSVNGQIRIRSFPAFLRVAVKVAEIMAKHSAKMDNIIEGNVPYGERVWNRIPPVVLTLTWEDVNGIPRIVGVSENEKKEVA